jgi:hypothetical protein
LKKTHQFVNSRVALGLPAAQWIHAISVYWHSNVEYASSFDDDVESLVGLVALADNLRELSLGPWTRKSAFVIASDVRASTMRMHYMDLPVLVFASEFRASALRTLCMDYSDDFFDRIPYLNQLANLDQLEIHFDNIIECSPPPTPDKDAMSQLTVPCLPRLRRLTFGGFSDMPGVYALFGRSGLESLQTVIIQSNEAVTETTVPDIRALIGRPCLRCVEFTVKPALYTQIFPYIMAERVQLRGQPITPVFVDLLPPTVQTLGLYHDGDPTSGLWPVLEHLSDSSTGTHLRSVSVLTYRIQFGLVPAELWSSPDFRWEARGGKEPDGREIVLRDRLPAYARRMADKGIRLCDSDGITLQEHAGVVRPVLLPRLCVSC